MTRYKNKEDKKAIGTSIRLSPNMKTKLKAFADADKRTVCGLIQKIVLEWLEARG